MGTHQWVPQSSGVVGTASGKVKPYKKAKTEGLRIELRNTNFPDVFLQN